MSGSSLEAMKRAPAPERSSFDVNRVDSQRATSDEVCGRDAALQGMLEQARANPLADPILIRRKLPLRVDFDAGSYNFPYVLASHVGAYVGWRSAVAPTQSL